MLCHLPASPAAAQMCSCSLLYPGSSTTSLTGNPTGISCQKDSLPNFSVQLCYLKCCPGGFSVAKKICGHPSACLVSHTVCTLVPAWAPSSFLPVRDELSWNVLQISLSPWVSPASQAGKLQQRDGMGWNEGIQGLPWLLPQTCVIRAWDLSKPLLFCPAMNTAMWEHPITARHVEQLKGFGYTEIPCVVKKLVCGDEGQSFSRLLLLSLPPPAGMCCLLLC